MSKKQAHAPHQVRGATGRKRGQPTKLNPKVIARICKALRNCCTIKNACALAGIGQSTYALWKEQAEAHQIKEYVEFMKAVRVAMAIAEEKLVKRVESASKKDWRAGLAILERRIPDDWQRRDFVRQEISGPNNGPIQSKVEIERPIDDAHLEKFILEFANKRNGLLKANGTNGNGHPANGNGHAHVGNGNGG